MSCTTSPALRRPLATLALPLLVPLAGLAGCDSTTEASATEASGPEGIEGTWVHVNEVYPNLIGYVEITSTTVTQANGDERDGCFYIMVLDLSHDGDDQYTLTPTEEGVTGSLVWTVVRDGDTLTIIDGGSPLTFESTNVRISDLKECAS